MIVTKDLTWRRLAEAEGFLTLGLPQKTLAILDSRTNWSSMPFEANLLAGLAYRELGEYHKAILFLEKSQRFQPGNSDVALALGWCYKRTNRLAQAIDSLSRAIRSNRDEPILYYNLACYWSLAGHVSNAVEQLQSALRLNPEMVHMVEAETDFDPIRTDPVFQALIRLESGTKPVSRMHNKQPKTSDS
jgi:tetratricopeptide (TPR) repeat protein